MSIGYLGSPNSSLTMSQLSASGLPLPVGGPGSVGGLEVQRLREELMASNLRLARWKEGITQARNVSRTSFVSSYVAVLFSCILLVDSRGRQTGKWKIQCRLRSRWNKTCCLHCQNLWVGLLPAKIMIFSAFPPEDWSLEETTSTWVSSDDLDEDSHNDLKFQSSHWLWQSTWFRTSHSGGCWLQVVQSGILAKKMKFYQSGVMIRTACSRSIFRSPVADNIWAMIICYTLPDDLRDPAVSTTTFRQSLKMHFFSAYQHV